MVQKYVTSPEAEMHGAAMQAYFKNLNSHDVKPYLEQILKKYGLTEISPNRWYPSQLALDLYRLITSQGGGMFDLVAIGMRMVEDAPYPAEVDSIQAALQGLNEGYKMGVRNFPSDEGYVIEELSQRHVRVYEYLPYPHDIMYGYIYGLARRFAPKGANLSVQRTFLVPNDPDADGAVYDITW
jgi:hypothetical protein